MHAPDGFRLAVFPEEVTIDEPAWGVRFRRETEFLDPDRTLLRLRMERVLRPIEFNAARYLDFATSALRTCGPDATTVVLTPRN